ncbi:radical SAM protein [Desulfoluna limicola]|uniref:radical SAM protein n=1 Tax=Desulfoluna limicola TaxID=2810562 RepID=UPI001F295B81|nr:radical SAM protein [Desulfoluna limicola]
MEQLQILWPVQGKIIQGITEENGILRQEALTALRAQTPHHEKMALHTALYWIRSGMSSIFLQDANTLVLNPDDLITILLHIREAFPRVERITSYARSYTIARISDDDMARFALAGLNRIHIGMESASDEVLAFVKKGVDKKTHILAGQKVVRAGIELSEYFMPGLGGKALSTESALETADAINQINPDFIRIRTLAIPETSALYTDLQNGTFSQMGDVETARELLLFLDTLNGVSSTVKSDHILNLFQDVDGTLPGDKETITAPLRSFLEMPPEDQLLYRVGRRTGIFTSLADMDDPELMNHALKAKQAHQVTLENVDRFTAEMMKRFI